MPLSWNEIKSRALAFTNEWKDEVSEDAEVKSFWDDFFHVFGISRRRVATFEQVKKIDSKQDYIKLTEDVATFNTGLSGAVNTEN